MASRMPELVKRFKKVNGELDWAQLELRDAKISIDLALEKLWSLRETLRETIEADHNVKVSAYEIRLFMEDAERVMVILDGKVRVFESEAALDNVGGVRIYASDFLLEG